MKVLIVEDHPLFAQSLSQYCLNKGYTVKWVKSYVAFQESISTMSFDLAFVDLMLKSGLDGFDVCKVLKEQYPLTKVVILSTFDDDHLLTKAEKMKVDGYLVKSAQLDDIEKAIESIESGKKYYSPGIRDKLKRKNDFFTRNKIGSLGLNKQKLTPREKEVIKQMVLHDHNDEALAEALEISYHTIRDHKKSIYLKLGVHDVAGIVKFYYKHLNTSKS